MVVTNRLNLPEALVNAVSTSPHNAPKCISATTLKNGVREILLTKRHWEELEDDVADRIWAVFGTAVHALLEQESPDTFTEEKFEIPVLDYKVTGRVDCYDMKNGIIFDYKTASVWKIQFNDFSDWYSQGMVYAWLLRKSGFEVNKCRFVAMLKDHSKTKARVDPSYPQSPVFVYEFDVTEEELEQIEKFIYDKVKLLTESENLADDELPLCTNAERWRDTEYAVIKAGQKRALRLFKEKDYGEQTLELAKKCAEDVGGEVVDRGEDRKCNGYCSCAEFCPYYKEHVAKAEEKEAV